MRKAFRAIGFDLGDTLIYYRDIPFSWVTLYPEALRSVGEACGVSPAPEQLAAGVQILSRYNTRMTPRTIEVPASEIFSDVLDAWGFNPATHLPAAIEAYFTFFQQQMCAYPETSSVLTTLREHGLPIGILTDVPYGMPRDFVQRDIDKACISGLFDVLLTSVEVGVRKPDPVGYLALAARLKVAPQEMIYVGNEPKDVIGAVGAGMTAVFLDRSKNGSNHGQHFTVCSLSGVGDIISGISKPTY